MTCRANARNDREPLLRLGPGGEFVRDYGPDAMTPSELLAPVTCVPPTGWYRVETPPPAIRVEWRNSTRMSRAMEHPAMLVGAGFVLGLMMVPVMLWVV